MTTNKKPIITVEASINAPVAKVWTLWTDPQHIVNWNNASDDWFTPRAENDLKVNSRFIWRMEARDGSSGFDFSGVYKKVEPHKKIEYTLDDNRKVEISFVSKGDRTLVKETFEAEDENSLELQRQGWQAILDNYRKYAESLLNMESLHFEIDIDVNPDKVYKTMLEKKHYEDWTSVFNPDSHFEGSWEKGSKILFFGTDQDGKKGGMVSRIRENLPGKYLSIEHLGVIEDGKEITSGPKVEGWAGATENYTFIDRKGKTTLSVELDSKEEFMSYFRETWPLALDRLKSICEK
jgi:uncharacterized protein YndB with AHSA1/START domain